MSGLFQRLINRLQYYNGGEGTTVAQCNADALPHRLQDRGRWNGRSLLGPGYKAGSQSRVEGDKDQAFQWLERSYQDRAWDITYLKVDPFMDNLHSDPRFADLVRRVGL